MHANTVPQLGVANIRVREVRLGLRSTPTCERLLTSAMYTHPTGVASDKAPAGAVLFTMVHGEPYIFLFQGEKSASRANSPNRAGALSQFVGATIADMHV